jgi:hypothetical protein
VVEEGELLCQLLIDVSVFLAETFYGECVWKERERKENNPTDK